MNIARTITVVASYADIVGALKAYNPTNIHIQGIPDVGGMGVSVEATAGKGLTLKYTTNINGPQAAPQLLLTGPTTDEPFKLLPGWSGGPVGDPARG